MSDPRENLPADLWQRVKEVFGAALERDPADRAAFLDQACGTEDTVVRREVEALLAAHQTSDPFLQSPAAAVAALTPRHRELGEGQTLGPYRVLRTLGHGGMATVYLARDGRHHRAVALKVMHPESAQLGPARFLREIEVAANLSHPHILPLFDSGEVEGLLYYVMPYIEGESLRDRLRRDTQLPVDEALQLGREVADALAYAHGQGVIHRDIKPENILLSGGHALVADFGIARALSQPDGVHLTETGVAIGTIAYMSPEQASGASHIDGRSDVYSLGCVVYEMLAGEPPYSGPTAYAIIASRLSDPVPRVRHLRPSVPEHVDQAVTRALAPIPADRPATVAEFAEALAAPVVGPSTAIRTPAVAGWVTTVRRKWRTPAVVVAATMVAIALAAVLVKQRGPAPALDPNVVAVAPFRVTTADPALGYLREGMVDLLAAKLTGQVGPRAADPRAVLSAWRRESGSDSGELPPEAALAVAKRLGAGRLLLGHVVGSPGGVSLHASMLAVPGGQAKAQATVEGPTDSLAVLVDRLAAQLRTLDAGEGEQRLATLTSTSLPALRGYLEGQALYRRGKYSDAATQFGHALDLDSTFGLAALGLLASGNRTGAFEQVSRGQDLAWAARERLTPRDHAYLMALIGSSYSDTTSYSAILAAAERFVRVASDRAEAWTTLGDDLYNFGEQLGLSDATGRGASAYRRALELDSSFAPALEGVVLMAARLGDTATVRRLGGRFLPEDSAGAVSRLVRWRTAVALDDTAVLRRLRAGFDTVSVDDLGAIGQLSQYDGVALEDAERATTVALHSESRFRYRLAILAEVAALALNRGRPAAALRARKEQQTLLQGQSNQPLILQIWDALYWDGDTTAGAAAARELGEIAAKAPADTYKRHLYFCALEQWRVAHGQLTTVRRSMAEMRRAEVTENYRPSGKLIVRGCVILLDALLAAAERRPDAGVYRQRLDSLMLTGPSYRNDNQAWNLVVARLKEAAGDRQGALAATRRRLYLVAEPVYLSTYLREEGRLAALTGDRSAAIRAYQHYLALRAAPEPALRAQTERVRTDLAELLREPTR